MEEEERRREVMRECEEEVLSPTVRRWSAG